MNTQTYNTAVHFRGLSFHDSGVHLRYTDGPSFVRDQWPNKSTPLLTFNLHELIHPRTGTIRWDAGKRLTNRPPKLSLTPLSPPGTDRILLLWGSTSHRHVVPNSGDIHKYFPTHCDFTRRFVSCRRRNLLRH